MCSSDPSESLRMRLVGLEIARLQNCYAISPCCHLLSENPHQDTQGMTTPGKLIASCGLASFATRRFRCSPVYSNVRFFFSPIHQAKGRGVQEGGDHVVGDRRREEAARDSQEGDVSGSAAPPHLSRMCTVCLPPLEDIPIDTLEGFSSYRY